jgi:hypothetical protein
MGGCRCGAVRYALAGEPVYSALCHCSDCRASSGAPMLGWAAFPAPSLAVLAGTPRTFRPGGDATRQFCGECGTGLFYTNEALLPGLVDVQIATLDDPERFPPQLRVQVAERLAGWSTRPGCPSSTATRRPERRAAHIAAISSAMRLALSPSP